MAIPRRQWMRENFGFRHNPFPGVAIITAGMDLRESGRIFEPTVVSEEVDQYCEKFIGEALDTGTKFNFLWSLGVGEGARGYGKSSLMLNMARMINADFGQAVLRRAGFDKDELVPIIASYTAFDTAKVTSFNAVFFEATRWFCIPSEAKADSINRKIRREIVNRLTQADPSVTSDLARLKREIVKAVQSTRYSMVGRQIGPMNYEFLEALADENLQAARAYLEEVSDYQRIRNGVVYFDTFVTYALTGGIKKVFVNIDQVEDLASTTVAKSKRIRETERFRDYAAETEPLASATSFILTMHPRAAGAIAEMWELARLPDFSPDLAESERRTIILKGIKNEDDAVRLFSIYLNEPQNILGSRPSELYPFDKEAIATIWDHENKRPGYMLRAACTILNQAADENVELINRDFALRVLTSAIPEVTGPEPSGLLEGEPGVPPVLE